MGLINSIETRSASVSDPNMWIGTLLESINYATKSGVSITPDTALKISTVYACVTILSQTVASLPMTINKKLPEGGNDIDEDHDLYPILHDEFNTEQTSFEARELGTSYLKLRGNWYNYIERTNGGKIIGIWPIDPSKMKPYRVNDEIWYEYQPATEDKKFNGRKLFADREIWHVKGFSKDGLTGLSTIQVARESMGLSQALQNYSAEFFGNKAIPGNVLEHPGALSAQAKSNLKASLKEYASSRRRETLILEEGLKWQNIGISNEDAQFIDLTNAQVRDIARWFDIPLILLQEPDKASTYASAEQFMLQYSKYTIWKITRRIEQSANKKLLTNSEHKDGYYIKLNLKGMQEGDFVTRMSGYKSGREGGWLCVDDIRELEDMKPLPDGKGKIYLQPMNYIEAGTENQPEPNQEGGDEDAI